MKFKERRGNVFVFNGGYDSEELELTDFYGTNLYLFKGVLEIDTWLNIYAHKESRGFTLDQAQTAVNLMTILKDEGLV